MNDECLDSKNGDASTCNIGLGVMHECCSVISRNTYIQTYIYIYGSIRMYSI